ncbi:unnamed protein product [Calypogeia fissa]
MAKKGKRRRSRSVNLCIRDCAPLHPVNPSVTPHPYGSLLDTARSRQPSARRGTRGTLTIPARARSADPPHPSAHLSTLRPVAVESASPSDAPSSAARCSLDCSPRPATQAGSPPGDAASSSTPWTGSFFGNPVAEPHPDEPEHPDDGDPNTANPSTLRPVAVGNASPSDAPSSAAGYSLDCSPRPATQAGSPPRDEASPSTPYTGSFFSNPVAVPQVRPEHPDDGDPNTGRPLTTEAPPSNLEPHADAEEPNSEPSWSGTNLWNLRWESRDP